MMNYSALIQNRRSVRAFSDKQVFPAVLDAVEAYYRNSALRLIPNLKTQLRIFGNEARERLEGAAGYQSFLIGAPRYLVLLCEQDRYAGIHAGCVMEDLILKLTELELDTCWLTFTDSGSIKSALGLSSELEVAAIAAFGRGAKTTKRLRLNVRSMSHVDISAQRQYFQPKVSVRDLVFLNDWGSTSGVEEFIGFYGDLLWEAFYAASLSPSYLNRQPYGFLIRDGRVTLVQKPDRYTGEIDSQLNLGVVLLHFTAAASQWAGELHWQFEGNPPIALPEGHRAIASCAL